MGSRCLLSTRPSLTLTTTPLALTWPFVFWLWSCDSRDTSSASPADSDDGHANCHLFSQLLLLKLIEIGHFENWLYTCTLRLLCCYLKLGVSPASLIQINQGVITVSPGPCEWLHHKGAARTCLKLSLFLSKTVADCIKLSQSSKIVAMCLNLSLILSHVPAPKAHTSQGTTHGYVNSWNDPALPDPDPPDPLLQHHPARSCLPSQLHPARRARRSGPPSPPTRPTVPPPTLPSMPPDPTSRAARAPRPGQQCPPTRPSVPADPSRRAPLPCPPCPPTRPVMPADPAHQACRPAQPSRPAGTYPLLRPLCR